MTTDPRWLQWAKRIQAIAQNGLAYTENKYDIERYEQLRSLALEIFEEHTGANREFLERLFEQETGYATPKVDVRGAVFRDEEVLLVKESADGRWTLPGGWADPYDTPREAVEREILEEGGYRARVVKLAALLDRNKQGHPFFPFHVYKLHFICELVDDRQEPLCIEVDEARFFPEDSIPPLSEGRILKSQIIRLFEHYRNPDLPMDID